MTTIKVQAASSTEIEAFLAKHPKWKLAQNKLYQKFVFKDFKECFSFMTKVADLAEEKQHHPEWFNVYNNLEIWLQTHDSKPPTGAISQKDFELALLIDALAS